MLKELMAPEIKELVESHRWNDLKEVLSSWPAPEVADLILDTDKIHRALLFRALPRNLAADVFSYLEYEQRDELLIDLTDQETRQLLADLSPDDRTELFEELPAKATKTLMNLLSPEDLKEARELLGYPEESIGRKMTPDFVAVRQDWTVSKALGHIRKFGKRSETIYRIYITDNRGTLLDDILLRNIILAKEDEKIENLMDYNFVSISAFADQEEAVKMFEKYDLTALPVVDSVGMLVGIVTFDDIYDISEEEATEDFQKISAINPVDQTYLSADVFRLWRKRIPWLAALLFANFITAAVISLYADIIQVFVALTFFMPMLTGTAGNTGTQSATLVIRALSIDEIQLKDWFKVFKKEMIVGSMLGIVLAILSYFRGMLEGHHDPTLSLVVGLSMLALILWANFIGAMLPLLIAKFKLDPTVISSPLISTFCDISGIFIYFTCAKWLLGL